MAAIARILSLAIAAGTAACSSSDDDRGAADAATEDAAAEDAAARDADAGGATLETRVFVSSQQYDGNLGGLAGGDARCQARADAAGLSGTWLAWLGDGIDGPATRFAHADTPYVLVGGGVVAENWPDLIDGTIGVPINHDETGTELPATDDMIVFTAVFHTGGNPTPVNCNRWTTSEVTLVPTGLASATDTGWTVTAPHNCSEMHRIYCFEQ